MPFSGSLSLALAANYSATLDVGTASYPISYSPGYSFSDGSGANQANKVFTDIRTLAASGSESLDLNGSLTDAFGVVLNFTRVRALIIQADATNVNDVVVGGAASNGFFPMFNASTEKAKVKPGGTLMFVAPDANAYAVTAGTADLLQIANGGAGTAINYTIIVIGS